MKNLHKAATLFNIAFFAAAAVAAFYLVYESWFYGFFLRPFPAVLTLIAIVFGGAALMAVQVARHGSQITCEPTVNISPLNEKLIRSLALALPLPIMAYAVLSSAVQTWYPASGAMFNTSVFYVECERFLFGTKRADDRLNTLAKHFYQQDNFPLAQRYAELAVTNLVDAQNVIFGSADSYKRRLVDRLDLLARVYEREGKNVEALATWQRKHIAIHQVHWTPRRMKWMCSMTLAKEAYNQQVLGHENKAERLYRMAERVMPEAICAQANLAAPGTHDCSKHTKMMPVFCNHARMILQAMPTDYAESAFSDQTNRYNPNLQPQRVSISNSFIMVPVAEYEKLTLGLLATEFDSPAPYADESEF